MLAVQEQPAARAQHASQLGERTRGIVDEGQRAAAADHGVEAGVDERQRLDAGLGETGARQALAGHGEQSGREVDAVGRPAQVGEDRRLEAGAAARVERAGAGRSRTELVAQDRVQARVEVLVPRLEIVICRRHRVEEIGDCRGHGWEFSGEEGFVNDKRTEAWTPRIPMRPLVSPDGGGRPEVSGLLERHAPLGIPGPQARGGLRGLATHDRWRRPHLPGRGGFAGQRRPGAPWWSGSSSAATSI